jgi:hypothetical protein
LGLEIGTDFYIILDEVSVKITSLKITKKSRNFVHSLSSVLSKRPAVPSDAATSSKIKFAGKMKMIFANDVPFDSQTCRYAAL